jgi:hypothetical protein
MFPISSGQIVFVVALIVVGWVFPHLARSFRNPFRHHMSRFFRSPGDIKTIADFDKICAKPIPFKWMGKIHYLEPIDLENFVETAEVMSQVFMKMEQAKTGLKFPTNDLLDMYALSIGSVCKSISRSDLATAPIAKTRALLQLCYDHITGRITYDPADAEKKSQLNPVEQEVFQRAQQHSS